MQSIPNIIFNPSLSIPQGQPITRPKSNPPLYDLSNLTPDFKNRLNQTKPPTKPNPTPIQPNPTPIQPNPTPIKPTQPPEVEPCYPNPQTDQSHPTPHKPVPIPDNPPLDVEPYP